MSYNHPWPGGVCPCDAEGDAVGYVDDTEITIGAEGGRVGVVLWFDGSGTFLDDVKMAPDQARRLAALLLVAAEECER